MKNQVTFIHLKVNNLRYAQYKHASEEHNLTNSEVFQETLLFLVHHQTGGKLEYSENSRNLYIYDNIKMPSAQSEFDVRRPKICLQKGHILPFRNCLQVQEYSLSKQPPSK